MTSSNCAVERYFDITFDDNPLRVGVCINVPAIGGLCKDDVLDDYCSRTDLAWAGQAVVCGMGDVQEG